MASTVKEHCHYLKEYYDFLLEAHRHRAILEQQQRAVPWESLSFRVTTLFDRLVAYDVQTTWQMGEPTLRFLHGCCWGGELATALVRWAQKLRWPQGESATANLADAGISWIELAFSFWFDTGVFLPIRRQVDDTERLLYVDSHAACDTCQISVGEWSRNFAAFHLQVEKLVGVSLAPNIPRKLIRSLYMQGANGHHSGYTLRPWIPYQAEVATLVRDMIALGAGPTFRSLPERSLTDRIDRRRLRSEIVDSWKTRDSLYQTVLKEHKAWKSLGSGQRRLTF